MDGYTASKEIRNIKELKEIPIIAITASAMKTSEEKIRLLTNSYIRKPFRKAELINELIKYLPYKMSADKREDNVGEVVKISEAVKERLPELSDILEKELNTTWKEITEVLIINDIAQFAEKSIELSKLYSYLPLGKWANDLKNSVELYDTGKINASLQLFPDIVNDIKEHYIYV